MDRIRRACAVTVFALAAACGGAQSGPAPDLSQQATGGEFAPYPYTVFQIRAGCQHRIIEYRTEKPRGVILDESWAFTNADSDSVNITTTTFDAAGKAMGTPATETARWADLHEHARFPRATTVIDADTITTPAGTFDCMRYVVTKGDEVKTYWFARNIAGPPVKMLVTKGGEQVMTMTMQANRTQ
jgi:hypothetical protein